MKNLFYLLDFNITSCHAVTMTVTMLSYFLGGEASPPHWPPMAIKLMTVSLMAQSQE